MAGPSWQRSERYVWAPRAVREGHRSRGAHVAEGGASWAGREGHGPCGAHVEVRGLGLRRRNGTEGEADVIRGTGGWARMSVREDACGLG